MTMCGRCGEGSSCRKSIRPAVTGGESSMSASILSESPPAAWLRPVARLRAWIPALTWLRSYDKRWLRLDLVAGVTLAAYLLPAGIGDASLANLPPQAGLYACLFSGLVFWLFCSSRHTAITVPSAVSLLLGASLRPFAGGGAPRVPAPAPAPA